MKPGDWQAAWADYRRRRQQVWMAQLGGFSILAMGTAFLNGQSASEPRFLALCGACAAGIVITRIRLAVFRCPNCGRAFITAWRINVPFRNRCRHCRIEIGGEPGTPA